MKVLLVKATLKKMARIADGSVNLNFNTMEEVSKADFTLMDAYWQQNGWLAFKLNEMDIDDLPDENAIVEGAKTPSQELRAALYVWHRSQGGTKDDFPEFYRRKMESFRQKILNRIPQ